MSKWLIALTAAGVILAVPSHGEAAGRTAHGGHQLAQGAGSDGRTYGWEIMTEQERREHRERMRNARTEQERARIQAENHERMEKRARERGITLPEEPGTGRGRGMRGGGMMDDMPRGGPGGGRGGR